VAPQFSLATLPEAYMLPGGLPYAPKASYAHATDILLCCRLPCATLPTGNWVHPWGSKRTSWRPVAPLGGSAWPLAYCRTRTSTDLV